MNSQEDDGDVSHKPLKLKNSTLILPVLRMKEENLDDSLIKADKWENVTDSIPFEENKQELIDLKEEPILTRELVIPEEHAMDGLNNESKYIKTEVWSGEDPLSLGEEQSGCVNAEKSTYDQLLLIPTTLQHLGERVYNPGQLHTHFGKRKHKCEICGKCFAQRGDLTRHLNTHSGKRDYKCETCEKCFTRSGHLATHLQTHSGERNHKCEICGKCFTQPWNLARHVDIHSGERNHKCKLCGKCFSQRASLARHLENHSGERKYKCVACEKLFTRCGHLARHLRTHSGERNHKCEECGKSFTRREHLRTHLQIHSDK